MKNKEKEAMKTQDIERRTLNIEYRNDGESRTVEGYAVVFGKESRFLGDWFYEVIERDAFAEADMTDVMALFNHNENYILARTANQSLTLEFDNTGLKYRFDVPETTYGNDLLINIRQGLINKSSFAFRVDEDDWKKEERDGEQVRVRTIKKISLLRDVSPVTDPAYDDTTVAARSYDKVKAEFEKEIENEDLPTEENVKIEADARARQIRLLAIR